MKNKEMTTLRDACKTWKETKDEIVFTLHDSYFITWGKLKFKISGEEFYDNVLGQMKVPKGGKK